MSSSGQIVGSLEESRLSSLGYVHDENWNWFLMDQETGALNPVDSVPFSSQTQVDTIQEARIRAKGVDPTTGTWIGGANSPYANGVWGNDPQQIIDQSTAEVNSQYAADYQKSVDSQKVWYEQIPWKTLLVLGIALLAFGTAHEAERL